MLQLEAAHITMDTLVAGYEQKHARQDQQVERAKTNLSNYACLDLNGQQRPRATKSCHRIKGFSLLAFAQQFPSSDALAKLRNVTETRCSGGQRQSSPHQLDEFWSANFLLENRKQPSSSRCPES